MCSFRYGTSTFFNSHNTSSLCLDFLLNFHACSNSVLRGTLAFGFLSGLCFFACFSSGGFHNLIYLLFGFALFCTILCWEPINNNKKNNIEPPHQKKKIMEPINKNNIAVSKKIKFAGSMFQDILLEHYEF